MDWKIGHRYNALIQCAKMIQMFAYTGKVTAYWLDDVRLTPPGRKDFLCWERFVTRE